jgi:site-specific recombinase XerD
MEKLPRTVPRPQIRELLQSINRSEQFGLRDFTLLYLTAAYGLRCSEVTRLKLDDIDWRARTLRVSQTKTKQALQLPLTDEAANVLIAYLRKVRPQSEHRHLFLRLNAPVGPLHPFSVNNVLRHRIHLSGLKFEASGSHMLRHSLATHLLEQGVAVKTIGDALGHKAIHSTSTYLRLNVEELRQVALPLPVSAGSSQPLDWAPSRHRPHWQRGHQRRLPKRLRSRFARTLTAFIDLKRALGRLYRNETATLYHLDQFLHRHYPRARRIRAEMFSRWSKELASLVPRVRHRNQCVVREFLIFQARGDAHAFIPDPTMFCKPSPTQSPRLITEAEMARLLNAASQVPPSFANPLRAETLRIGLVLLFCCGLRVGELLRLRLGDIDPAQRLLHIQLTKFHKSRLVPLSPSVSNELEQYLQLRPSRGMPAAADAFLMWSQRGPRQVLRAGSLNRLWHRLCFTLQVINDRGYPPRLHDLRHSFTVCALQRWYAQGDDVQAKLPHLATYLGHANLSCTHYYLKLTPELRAAADQRFHARFARLFHTGGVL